MSRKLATIRQISAIDPIPGADAIEVARVDGWKVVVKKNEFITGDAAVYFEIDSFLPERPEFEFLRKTSWRKQADGSQGFRLRTLKLRGQVSQGLLLPLSSLPADCPQALGSDITDALGVVKWDPPIPTELGGEVRGPFPSRVPKTDEERVQNLPELFQSNLSFSITEKLDGASATFYHDQDSFGVCSRNWDLLESPTNSLWRWAREVGLPDKLASLKRNLAIQGELIGPGVQGNIYRLAKTDVRLFNAFDIDTQQYLTVDALLELATTLQVQTVPILARHMSLSHFADVDAILQYAEATSALNPKTQREGIVFRSEGTMDKISFKAISNRFLLASDG